MKGECLLAVQSEVLKFHGCKFADTGNVYVIIVTWNLPFHNSFEESKKQYTMQTRSMLLWQTCPWKVAPL